MNQDIDYQLQEVYYQTQNQNPQTSFDLRNETNNTPSHNHYYKDRN
jgi:hypothetical protein